MQRINKMRIAKEKQRKGFELNSTEEQGKGKAKKDYEKLRKSTEEQSRAKERRGWQRDGFDMLGNGKEI